MNAIWEGSWKRQDCQEQLQEDGRRRVSLSEGHPPRQRASDSPAQSFVLSTLTDSLPWDMLGTQEQPAHPQGHLGRKRARGLSAVTPRFRGARVGPRSATESGEAPQPQDALSKSRRLKGGSLCIALKGKGREGEKGPMLWAAGPGEQRATSQVEQAWAAGSW